MRCLIVHNYYQKRGEEDSVFEAESGLLSSGGHDVESYTLHNDSLTGRSRIAIAADTVWSRDIYRQMTQSVREFKPDIVHFHNTFPLISPAAVYAAKNAGAAVVMSLHNYRLLCPSADLYRDENVCEDCFGRTVKWPAVMHRCYRGSAAQSGIVALMSVVHRLDGRFGRVADRYIAVSEHSRSLFIRAGLSPDRVVVKPNFVVQPPPIADVAREGFVLFVGRLVPDKGISTLLEAWRSPSAPQVPLMVVGDGPLASEVGRAGGNVRLLGKKTPSEVQALMRRASLLVFPSEWREPFGLAIVEAFANELPVLAAGIGAAPELVDPGRTGFLFEAGNSQLLARAAHYALESPEALHGMGLAAGLEYRMKYTPGRNLELLEAIYCDALNDRIVPAPAESLSRAQPHPTRRAERPADYQRSPAE
jgi:glycosyltransferase involved in cell wall biosynthesis